MKFLKKLGIGIFLFIILIALISTIIATFFGNQVGNKLLTEINKNLKSELKIEEFDLSLISGFPNLSVNLRNVNLADANEGTLLEAENLAFRFGFFSLFGSNIKIKSVVAQHGALYIYTDKDGNANYDILKISDSAKEETSSDMGFSLKEAKLEDIEIIYIDERTQQETKLMAEDALFSGQFSSDRFAMQSVANVKTDFIDMDGLRFFAGKAVSYDANVDVDLEKGNYIFDNVEVDIESNVFRINGNIKGTKEGSIYDLIVVTEDGNMESIIQLLPKEYLEYVGDIRSTGTFLFNTTVEGLLSKSSNPAIKMNFGLEDGVIKSPRLKNSFKDVSFKAGFSNGEDQNNKTSIFGIRDFKGYFNRELTEMKFTVGNLDDPRIDFNLDGTIPMASIYKFLGSESITDGDGEIEVKELKIKGKYEDMLSPNRISRVDASGQIEFDDASLTINKETLIVDRGDLVLKDNDLQVKQVKIEGAGSQLLLNGDFYNLIPVLFADSLNSKKAELEFDAKLDAISVDLDRLMTISELQVEKGDVEEEVYDSLVVAQNIERERLTNFLNGKFDIHIAKFNYNEIDAEDFDGSLTFENNEILMDGDVETMGGSMNLEGKAYVEEKPRMKSNIICKNIDVKEFFRQTENFGQDFITDEHLKGNLNAHITANSYWDEEGNFLDEKLRVFAGVSITDGELIRLKMLEDFSAFVKIKDLRHIKFTNMQNWFEVSKGKLNMPVMFIQSNALNMMLSGEHSFEHDIDYNIQVNAGQVLWNKFKLHDPKLRPHKAQKKGWFNLYYKIDGTLDDYDMRNSKREVQVDFIRSEHRKREVRKQLEKEFGKIKLIDNEPADWRDKKPIPEYPEANEVKVDNTRASQDTRASVKEEFKKLFMPDTDEEIPDDEEEEEEEFLFEEEGEGK